MKTVLLVMFLAMPAFANYADVTDEIDEILVKYDVCGNDETELKSMEEFKSMLAELKTQKGLTPLEVPDFSLNFITILNRDSKKECTLGIDAYEGRCVYAVCN